MDLLALFAIYEELMVEPLEILGEWREIVMTPFETMMLSWWGL